MSQYYTITEQYHEKKGTYIFVLRLIKKVDKDEFSNLCEYAKDYDGYYSSYRGVNGFVFQNEEDAESFGAILDSYFGTSDIQEVVNETLEDAIEDVVSQKNPRNKRPRIPSSSAVSDKSIDSTQMSSGLPLHIALRNIIQTDGDNIINELRLINILDDFHAFDAIPASKYILRAVIADGYTSKLIVIGDWNNKAQQLSNRFASITGFIPENVDIIFQSIAYGLRWINDIQPYDAMGFGSKNHVRNEANNSSLHPHGKLTSKEKHLEFKGFEICGHPKEFSKKLKAVGYSIDYWTEDSVVMNGSFAGSPNCKLYIKFYPNENIVYSVWVTFQTYKSKARVIDDYNRLKHNLQLLYGIPECDRESDDSFCDWNANFNTSNGMIKLSIIGFVEYFVSIEYIDGHYELHNSSIDDEIALIDL